MTTTTTLLTHEYLRTRGVLGTFFGLVGLVVILGSLLAMTGWPILSELGLILAPLGLLALVPGTQLLLTADYWRSGYGRTGYFTHSIPVRGATIFRAKLAWVMIASVAALAVTLALGLLAWWAVSTQASIDAPSAGLIGSWWSAITDSAPGWLIAAGVVVLLASVLAWPVYYFFAVSVGNESRLAGLGAGGPVVVFVVLYVAQQLAAFLGMVILPLGVGMEGDRLGIVRFDVLSELAAGSTTSDVMPIGFVLTLGMLLAFCAWRTARSWNRRVALN